MAQGKFYKLTKANHHGLSPVNQVARVMQFDNISVNSYKNKYQSLYMLTNYKAIYTCGALKHQSKPCLVNKKPVPHAQI